MKKTILLLLMAMIVIAPSTFAQKKNSVIEIKTSAVCGMCKDRIEKVLSYEKGVISSTLDLETKIVKIEYKESKTNPDKLRLVLSQTGYQADDIPADPVAYSKLPACCKAGGHSGGCGGNH
jgi:copper chaperone CopZ